MAQITHQFLQCSSILTVDPAIRQFGGVILVTPDSGVMLQLRDDNPNITDPGCLAVFAGAAEPGESPLEATLREAEEETGRRFRSDELTFLTTYTKEIVGYYFAIQHVTAP